MACNEQNKEKQGGEFVSIPLAGCGLQWLTFVLFLAADGGPATPAIVGWGAVMPVF